MESTLEQQLLLGRVQNLLVSGYSCAQSVFCPFAAQLHLSHEDAFRISAGFGGGMAFGEVCGAVTGAIMVIGLKSASWNADVKDTYAKERTYELCHEFMKTLKMRIGSLCCRDLIGFDLGKFGNEHHILNADRDLYVHCPGYVRSAAEILFDILNGSDE
ncbi:MAG: C_GCAxxG_C_C family protein [Deltaproteobacteria bacterium]|nr:C_GCAxxG_C_C family protein [Deltaproteobacteria bacterium]